MTNTNRSTVRNNWIKYEGDFNRVFSAIKKIADDDTLKSLNEISYYLSEIRHAAIMSSEREADFTDIKDRLLQALLERTE